MIRFSASSEAQQVLRFAVLHRPRTSAPGDNIKKMMSLSGFLKGLISGLVEWKNYTGKAHIFHGRKPWFPVKIVP